MINAKPITKAEILEEYIVKNILPKYKPGSKIPSELIMAKELNTSRATVHKIFSTLTTKGMLYRENGLGTFVSEPKKEQPRTRVITLVSSSDRWQNHLEDASWFNTQFLLEGVSHALHGKDYYLNILYLHPDEQSLEEGVEILLNTNSDGFVFVDVSGYDSYVKRLMELGKLCVARSLTPYLPCHSLWGNLEDGFYDAMKHLLETGRRNVLFLAYRADENDQYSNLKLKGVHRAMKEYGLNNDELMEFYVDAPFELDAYRAMARFLAKNKDVDAIISSSDRLAFGAFEAVKDAGLLIPEDIAIIGSDDLKQCETMNPPMASITYPFYEIGKNIFHIIDNALNNVDTALVHQEMKCTFIARESCAAKS